ncbi:MAG: DUF2516 domain-containing protein [Actinobacteria bacterium HGW-Actinobacteria-4]|nr:MAG: DUF2516 domain-containing protein [Actinobacteria bacterium HGW-Actinobacteria-4]
MFASLQHLLVLVISVAVFVAAVVAVFDALRHTNGAYVAAGKNKAVWVGILCVAGAIAFVSLPPPLGGGRGFIGLLSIASIIAVLYYFVDVRKKVKGNEPPSSYGRGPSRGGW